ncbi:hypothetical protein Hanom_Chr05g00471541 [Helianthus anomalus]
MRVFGFHAILTFPSKLWVVTQIPSNLDKFNYTLSSLVNLPINNLNGFFGKVECAVYVNFISRDDLCLLSWTFL